jgi:hypothetical protein
MAEIWAWLRARIQTATLADDLRTKWFASRYRSIDYELDKILKPTDTVICQAQLRSTKVYRSCT